MFPFLTAEQGQLLRQHVTAAFADRDVRVEVVGGDAATDDGRTFGLAPLAAAVLDVGPVGHAGTATGTHADAVRELSSRFVARALAVDASPAVASLDRGDVLARAFLRVIGVATLPEHATERLHSARHLAGDLAEVVALQEPTAVRILTDEDLAAVGATAARAAGLRNLLTVPVENLQFLDGAHGGRVHVVTGTSPFTASLLLVLSEVLRRTIGPPDLVAPHGVLVAVPYRHQLAFAPVQPRTVLPALELLVPLAARAFEQGVGPVSPFVYWWDEGRLTQVSVLTEAGGWAVDDTGDFGALIDRLLPS